MLSRKSLTVCLSGSEKIEGTGSLVANVQKTGIEAISKIDASASIREIVFPDYQDFSVASKLPGIARNGEKPGPDRAFGSDM